MVKISTVNSTQNVSASIPTQQNQNLKTDEPLFDNSKNVKTALEKKLMNYGINPSLADWINIVDAQEVDVSNSPDNCKSLCLTSYEGFKIYIPLDNKVNPGDVVWYRAEDEANIHFENFNGTVVITADEYSPGFSFDKNCNAKVYCKDGISDYIAFSNGGKGEIITNDYADKVRLNDEEEHRLSPGVHKFNTEG